jgi:hypothetical protein
VYYVLTGKARQRVVAAAVKAFNENPEGLIPLSDAQGVERSDKIGRRRDVARQFMFFDAPVGLIFTMDRLLVPASFICYGAFLQTIHARCSGAGPRYVSAASPRHLRTDSLTVRAA